MFRVITTLLVCSFFSLVSYAETLQVQIDCKSGVCIPANQDVKTDVDKLQKQIVKVRKQLERVEQAVGLTEDVVRLKDQMKSVNDELSELKKLVMLHSSNIADIVISVGELKDNISELENKSSVLAKKIKSVEIDVNSRFDSIKNDLHIGLYGIPSYPFGNSLGLLLTLKFPLGTKNLWKSHFSGGLGLSPSVNVGYLTSLSIDRSLHRNISLGPIMLFFGDLKNVMSDKLLWTAAIGANLRVKWEKFNFSIAPFIGVGTSESSFIEIGDVVYKDTLCGKVVDSSSSKQVITKSAAFQSGVLLTLSYSLFN